MKRSEAIYLRSIVEQAVASLDDKTASTAPTLLRSMKYDGKLIKGGTRINWNGVVKKAAVDLWDIKENNPDNASTLWEDILYRAGHRIIPEVITVGLAFSNGETGWEGDVLYRSKKDNNVYPPSVRPDDWEVTEAHDLEL